MTRKHFSRLSLESCTLKLNNWKPFFLSSNLHNPNISARKQNPGDPTAFFYLPTKKQCISDRPNGRLPSISTHMEFLEIANLNLMEENGTNQQPKNMARDFRCTWKRRRRGSRSTSSRSSSNRSRMAVAAASTPNSSGELFFNFDANWVSDALKGSCMKEGKEFLGDGENFCSSNCSSHGVVDSESPDSGYVSEPGYRGDVECGYDDGLDEEDEDEPFLFWSDSGADAMEIEDRKKDVAVNACSEKKTCQRCRHRKHVCRMVAP